MRLWSFLTKFFFEMFKLCNFVIFPIISAVILDIRNRNRESKKGKSKVGVTQIQTAFWRR